LFVQVQAMTNGKVLSRDFVIGCQGISLRNWVQDLNGNCARNCSDNETSGQTCLYRWLVLSFKDIV